MRLRLLILGIGAVGCSLAALRVAIGLHKGVFVILTAVLTVASVRKTILVYRSF